MVSRAATPASLRSSSPSQPNPRGSSTTVGTLIPHSFCVSRAKRHILVAHQTPNCIACRPISRQLQWNVVQSLLVAHTVHRPAIVWLQDEEGVEAPLQGLLLCGARGSIAHHLQNTSAPQANGHQEQGKGHLDPHARHAESGASLLDEWSGRCIFKCFKEITNKSLLDI